MLRPYLQLSRIVYLLSVGMFINRAGSLLIPFLTIYMKDEMGRGVQFATLTMGFFGLGSVLGQTIGGHLTDRLGRRTVMLLALFGGAVLMAALAFIRMPLAFAAGTCLLAVVSEMLRPAVQAMMADVTTPDERPFAFALIYVAINLGFAIGPAVGGFLAEWSFQLLFFADAATTALYGVIILLFVPETRPQPATAAVTARQRAAAAERSAPEPPGYSGFWASLGYIAKDRTFVAFSAGCFLVSLVFMQSMSTFPLYLEELGFGPKTYGKIISVNGWLIVLLQVPLTALLARYSRAGRLVIAALLTGLGVGLQAFAATPWHFVAAVSIWTVGEIMQVPLLGPIVADLAPLEMRGRYMGVFGMCFAGANMLGAPLGGFALMHIGGRYIWGLCALLGLAAAVIYGYVVPRINRNKPASEPQAVTVASSS